MAILKRRSFSADLIFFQDIAMTPVGFARTARRDPSSWCLGFALLAAAFVAVPAAAQTQAATIAVIASRTGAGASAGIPMLEAIELAVSEANASGDAPRIALESHDDRS